ncbi:PaaX family transcriptional regulator [Kineococcus sp. SYSU DK018]|uniref:PaaX family transcriptional regulator n=1 Tax=Kineococcus sp. SYSU DK018 TaxID=3383139 RepID=UPI003D7CE731
MATADPIDDIDARPGSVTSLLRTVLATYVRPLGGWIAITPLIQLMADAGVPAPRTRTALVRVKAKGLLHAEAREGVPGYAFTEQAHPMLVRAHQRIHHPRAMSSGEAWCLISFSIPEQLRDLRHQLRRRLRYFGCGTVSAALWVAPRYLTEEIEEVLQELGVREHCTLFAAEEIRPLRDLRTSVAQWWDFTELAALHQGFLDRHAEQITRLQHPRPHEAFSLWVRALDQWRLIPYNDPGLPAQLLPADWPGLVATPLFFRLRDQVAPVAAEHVRALTATTSGIRAPLPAHFEECSVAELARTA